MATISDEKSAFLADKSSLSHCHTKKNWNIGTSMDLEAHLMYVYKFGEVQFSNSGVLFDYFRMVLVWKKRHTWLIISEHTWPILTKFSAQLKGCYYGNQLIWGQTINSDWYHCRSLRWLSTVNWNIAISMSTLTVAILQLHHVKIWWTSVN